MASEVASFVVDCLPVIGTLKQGIEFCDAVASGDTNKAVEKGVGTAVSLFFDLTGASSLYNAVSTGAKAGAQQVAKKGVQEVAKKGAQEVAETGLTLAFKSVATEVVMEKSVEYAGKKITTKIAVKHVERECSVHVTERVVCLLAVKGVCHCVNCQASQKQAA